MIKKLICWLLGHDRVGALLDFMEQIEADQPPTDKEKVFRCTRCGKMLV